MANSVNTNVALLGALGAMNVARAQIDGAEKRLQTGYRVSDAADDAAVFAVAQQARFDVKAWDEVMRAQGRARGAVTTALEGLTNISDLLNRLEAVVVAHAGAGAQQQAIYANDADAILRQIDAMANGATFDGANLLTRADIGSSSDPAVTSVALGAPQSSAGGFGISTQTFALPLGTPGTVVLRYDMYGAPDGAALNYNGATVATTGGLVSGQGVLTFNFGGGAPASIDVEMNGGSVGTAWTFTLEFVTPTMTVAPTDQPEGSFKVIADIQGGQTSIRTVNATSTGIGLDPWSISPAQTALLAVRTARERVAAHLGYFAERTRTLDSVAERARSIMDATITGLGALVDADIGKSQAQALAARAKLELAINSVGIANQSQRAILGFLERI